MGGVGGYSVEETSTVEQQSSPKVSREDDSPSSAKEPSKGNEESRRVGAALEVPMSSIQFMSQWKSLKGNQQQLTAYFKVRGEGTHGSSVVMGHVV